MGLNGTEPRAGDLGSCLGSSSDLLGDLDQVPSSLWSSVKEQCQERDGDWI